jgi:hypothetical protein
VYGSLANAIALAQAAAARIGRKYPRVIPMPKSLIPAVAANVSSAQLVGHPSTLTRTTSIQAELNRSMALSGLGSPPTGLSWDEYPFASSVQGGFGAQVRAVPRLENSIQGGIIAACYILEGITVGTTYLVMPIP